MPHNTHDRESERPLHLLIGYALFRDVTHTELIEALGIGRTTYYQQRDEGRLTNPENLINAAHHFGLNPVELLWTYGHITAEDAVEFANAFVAANSPESDMPPEHQPQT